MNVLWIEDNENIKELTQELFGKPEDLKFDLMIPTCFDESCSLIENAIERIDYFIFDIDLNKFEIGKSGSQIIAEFNISEDEFKREAGFHLYLKLIKKGVGNERIIFLTGNTSPDNSMIKYINSLENAFQKNDKELTKTSLEKINSLLSEEDSNNLNSKLQDSKDVVLSFLERFKSNETQNNTYDIFKTSFKNARLSLAKSIHKDNKEEINLWINQNIIEFNTYTNYLNLRRGVIDGCNYLIEQINNKTDEELIDFLNFSKTIKKFEASDATILKENVKNYLEKISKILPFNGNSTNNSFNIFLRELSSEWEASEGFFTDKKITEGWTDEEKNFKNMSVTVMKTLRNWTAHNLISETPSIQDVGFLFLVSMHGYFNLKLNITREFEKTIFKCFEKTDQSIINTDINSKLIKSYYEIRKMFNGTNPTRNEFYQLVKESGFKPEDTVRFKNDSINLLYKCFWHSFYKLSVTICDPQNEISKNPNLTAITFKIFFNNLSISKGDFITNLQESCYKYTKF